MYRSSLGKETDGDYLLVVSGSTELAFWLKGWQDFKDHLRIVVREQPGWVDVFPNQNQRQGETQGWARLKHYEDADAAYKLYHRSKGMLVHVWMTCRNSDGFQLRQCNCSIHFPEVPAGGHSPGRCGIDFARFKGQNSQGIPVPNSPYQAPQTTYPFPLYPQPSMLTATPTYAVHVSQPAVYSTGMNGIPMNVSTGNGTVLTEARGVLIRNLNSRIKPEELVSLLNTVGRPIHYVLHRDSRTGAFKGVATAEFASRMEAQYAVSVLNGREHLGMRLDVRMGTESPVIGRSDPVIANGSFANYSYTV